MKCIARQVIEWCLESHISGVWIHLKHLFRDFRRRQEVEEVVDPSVEPLVCVPGLKINDKL